VGREKGRDHRGEAGARFEERGIVQREIVCRMGGKRRGLKEGP